MVDLRFKIGDLFIHKSDGISNTILVGKIIRMLGSEAYEYSLLKIIDGENKPYMKQFHEESNFGKYCFKIESEEDAWLWLI